MRRVCNRQGCGSPSFETDGRKWYCSRDCQLSVWRGHSQPIQEVPRAEPGSRPVRVVSAYSHTHAEELHLLAGDEGVSMGEMQRRIVTGYLEGRTP